jgi:hypothetical protein
METITLKGYFNDNHTDQQVYDFVKEKLIEQKIPSVGSDNGNGCAYRGHDDAKCAIGHLIPDEDYSSEMENKGVGRLLDYLQSIDYIGTQRPYIKEYFLSRLQGVHDMAVQFSTVGGNKSYLELLEAYLENLAVERKLQP